MANFDHSTNKVNIAYERYSADATEINLGKLLQACRDITFRKYKKQLGFDDADEVAGLVMITIWRTLPGTTHPKPRKAYNCRRGAFATHASVVAHSTFLDFLKHRDSLKTDSLDVGWDRDDTDDDSRTPRREAVYDDTVYLDEN